MLRSVVRESGQSDALEFIVEVRFKFAQFQIHIACQQRHWRQKER
jgi:hypothetical protein